MNLGCCAALLVCVTECRKVMFYVRLGPRPEQDRTPVGLAVNRV